MLFVYGTLLSQDDDKFGSYYLHGQHVLYQSTLDGNTCLKTQIIYDSVPKKITSYQISSDSTSVDTLNKWVWIKKENIQYDSCNIEKMLPSGAKFSIIKTIPETKNSPKYYIISFPPWSKEKVTEYKNNSLKTANGSIKRGANIDTVYFVPSRNTEEFSVVNDQKIYFRISEAQLDRIATKIKPIAEPMIGAMTFPFKFRMDKEGMFFTKDISLTGLGGIKFNCRKVKDLSVSIYTGIGLTSVALNPSNTDSTLTETTNRAGASIPIGILLQWKMLQVGVSTGFDLLSKESRDNWRFHGKPWLSFGIGISIFTPESTTRKPKVTNE